MSLPRCARRTGRASAGRGAALSTSTGRGSIVGLEADFLGTWLSPGRVRARSTRARAGRRRWAVSARPVRIGPVGHGQQRRPARRRAPLGARPGGAGAARACGAHGPARGAARRRSSSRRRAPALLDAVARRPLASIAASRWSSAAVNDPAVQVGRQPRSTRCSATSARRSISTGPRCSGRGTTARCRRCRRHGAGRGARAAALGGQPGLRPPEAGRFCAALGQRRPVKVSFADRRDETGGARPTRSARTTTSSRRGATPSRSRALQPAPAGHRARSSTRAPPPESLLRWAGRPADSHAPARGLAAGGLPPAGRCASFDDFWDRCAGARRRRAARWPRRRRARARPGDWRRGGRRHRRRACAARALAAARRLRDPPLRERRGCATAATPTTPGCQELPDPVTRSPGETRRRSRPRCAERWACATGDVVSLAIERGELELPVLVQPGQRRAHDLGRARLRATGRGQGGRRRRRQRLPLAARHRRLARACRAPRRASTRRAGGRGSAPAQTHLSMEGRPIVQRDRAASMATSTRHGDEAARRCRTCGPSGRRVDTRGGWRSISTRAPAARRASSPARRRTTCPSSGEDEVRKQPRDALDAHRSLLRGPDGRRRAASTSR